MGRFDNSERELTEDEIDGVTKNWSLNGEMDLDTDKLGTGPIASHFDYLSKSRLKTKEKCERKLGYKYINEVKPDENFYMVRGTNIHDSFEKYHQNVKAYVAANRCFPESLTELLGHGSEWFQFIDWVIPFFDWELERFEEAKKNTETLDAALDAWVPHSLERDLWIDDPPVGDLPWRGPYDALVESQSVPEIDATEGYTVVDYKTGSTPNEEYRDEGIHIDLCFYSWMLEIKGFNVTGAVGFYPTGDNHVVREVPQPEIRGRIISTIQYLHNNDVTKANMPINPQPLCDWCQFQEQCPTSWDREGKGN